MYPKWIDKVTRLACKNCRYCTSFHDIVAIGMMRASRREPQIGPRAMIILACPGCGGRMQVTVRRPIDSVILAMHELVRVADKAGHDAPPINLGEHKSEDPGVPITQKTSDDSSPVRPSRRDDQPDTPPTPREIQLFLRRLRKTSFNRNSKGFNGWMKDLGADDGHNADPT
jgi:hypothetical protein